MTDTFDHPLGGFEQRLLGELRELVSARATGAGRPAVPTPAPRARRRRAALSSRRSLATGGLLAVLAGAVALAALSASPAPGLARTFAVFARPATPISRAALASMVRDSGATVSHARLDARRARAFNTPLGTGYVIADTRANVICVAAPGFDGSWGAACRGLRAAQRAGAGVGGLAIYGRLGQAEYVAILPRGATATTGAPGHAARALPLPGGVLAFVVHGPTVIRTRVGGRVSTVVVRPGVRSARVRVPPRSAVAAPVRFRIGPGRGRAELTAAFRTRYGVRAGRSAYVLEYAPLPGTHPRCPGSEQPADTIDEQTTRDVPAGTPLTLRGGAPDCPGRWRLTVFLAASRGDVHFPGQAWAQPLDGATTPPRGSGDRIVATAVRRVRR